MKWEKWEPPVLKVCVDPAVVKGLLDLLVRQGRPAPPGLAVTSVRQAWMVSAVFRVQ